MNQYQRSETESSLTAKSLTIVLALAAAVGLYLNNQNKANYYNAANSGAYSTPSNREKTAEEISNDLKLKEQSHPTKYFQLTGVENYLNLVHEMVLKGSIVCTSQVARFKDVTIEASYYSASNTLLGREQFPRYEIWGPGSRVRYKFKSNPPAHTRKVNVQIVGAVPTE